MYTRNGYNALLIKAFTPPTTPEERDISTIRQPLNIKNCTT